MIAADARRIVHDLDLDEHVAKVVADAPPLSDTQRERLRAIFRNAKNPGSAGRGPSSAPHQRVPSAHRPMNEQGSVGDG